MSRQCFVYDLRLGDTILYVGSSFNPFERYYGHVKWWEFMRDVDVHVVSTHDSAEEAQRAEIERIVAIAPPLNIDWHPDCGKNLKRRQARRKVVDAERLRLEKAYVDARMERYRLVMEQLERELKK